jgi:hypothetical protein
MLEAPVLEQRARVLAEVVRRVRLWLRRSGTQLGRMTDRGNGAGRRVLDVPQGLGLVEVRFSEERRVVHHRRAHDVGLLEQRHPLLRRALHEGGFDDLCQILAGRQTLGAGVETWIGRQLRLAERGAEGRPSLREIGGDHDVTVAGAVRLVR